MTAHGCAKCSSGRQVLEEIESADWTPSYPLSMIVTNGIVHIWGVIEASPQRVALKVLAEGVPGVRGTEINVVMIPAYAFAEREATLHETFAARSPSPV